ncbi:MAG: adenylate cyclase [Cryomorphaceae bacterium]|jgi:adenylate cyclase
MLKKILIILGLVLTTMLSLDLFNKQLRIGGQKINFDLPFVEALERQAYDWRIWLSSRTEVDSRVVIIDVDEPSLLAEGQWPWHRGKVANLVNTLFDEYQIDTLGFDILFAEPEDSYTRAEVAQALEDESIGMAELEARSGDVLLANAISGRKVVLGIVFEKQEKQGAIVASVGGLPSPVFGDDDALNQALINETNAPVADRYSANIDMHQNAAGHAGFFSMLSQSPDGSIRSVEVLTEYDSKLYASLPLKMVQVYLEDELYPILAEETQHDYHRLEGISTISGDIPLDWQGGVYVPYAQQGRGYEYISATDILQGTYKGNLQDAIALIGTTSAGLVDRRHTPVAPSLPGVEVHANVITAMLDASFKIQPSWVTGADLFVLLVIGILLTFLLPMLSASLSSLLFITLSLGMIGGNWYIWNTLNYVLSIAPVLLLMSAIYVVNMVVGFFAESQARKVSQKMFGLYVPPEVVSKMSSNTDIYSLKSERREMTVLFADIRDFTTISESMNPDDLSQWLNAFLTPMTKIIHSNGGAIDKYMGDAIMAFWGAPLEDPKHTEHAISAALEMLEYLDTLNAKFEKQGWPTVRIGIGVNSGMMSVGNMGSEFRMAYTVVGDAVNLGSRLEGLTKQYHVPLVVSEFTKALCPVFSYLELDRVKVKGKSEAVTIYACSRPS